jgi:hypothetical protein
LIGGWYSEFGTLNKWVHIWAYRDAAERFAVREAAAASGNWPAAIRRGWCTGGKMRRCCQRRFQRSDRLRRFAE